MPHQSQTGNPGPQAWPAWPHAMLALVPLLTLAAFAAGGGAWVVGPAMLVQALGMAAVLRHRPPPSRSSVELGTLTDRGAVEAILAHVPDAAQGAALVLRIDDIARLEGRHGSRYLRALVHELAHRLGDALRDHDRFCRLEPAGFGIALHPQRTLELDAVLAIAQRIQARLGQSFSFEAVTVWPSVSVGFCMSPRAARLSGLGMLAAAEQAAERAAQAGPGALYSYSAVDFPAHLCGDRQDELREALETGAIRAHFQPQIDAATGQVSGLEALARWEHPRRGVLPPAEFLPLLETAGLSGRLAERMLRDALDLLAALDAGGVAVPCVSVNLSSSELRNPHLADLIGWELDRCALAPSRLVVEVLETVVADSDNDVAVRTIARLAAMGCGIDLDDFGTGHASISNIRRFAVGRLKIDRSFVTRLDEDRERQRMVAAIVSMAGELGLGTVAEGVETAADMARLAGLGCDHLQGYAIARPLPPEAVADWVASRAQAPGVVSWPGTPESAIGARPLARTAARERRKLEGRTEPPGESA